MLDWKVNLDTLIEETMAFAKSVRVVPIKLSPVDQHDLRDLIDMGLVEMPNDAPVLTNAGVNAIV